MAKYFQNRMLQGKIEKQFLRVRDIGINKAKLQIHKNKIVLT